MQISKVLQVSRFSWRYWYYAFEGFLYHKSIHSNHIREFLTNLKPGPLLIVCNGPSLNQTPLEEFAGIQSIGLNKIHLIFDRTSWRPNIILSMNRHVIEDWQDTFLASNIPTGLAWQSRSSVRKENRGKFTYFLNQYLEDFSKDISSGFDAGATITYTALQFAYHAGSDPVIIVGLDHRFETKGDPNKLVVSETTDSNHFDPSYFGKGKKWNLPDLPASEKAFRLARQTFENDNRTIYDATINGNLDIFEKISIDKALELCRRNNM